MELDIPRDEYEEISRLIHSDESPVGIDAKKTHILILHRLARLEKRLRHIESELERT